LRFSRKARGLAAVLILTAPALAGVQGNLPPPAHSAGFFALWFTCRVATSGQAVWMVLRGGSFNNNRDNAHRAYRQVR
jgi:hypothetical protein